MEPRQRCKDRRWLVRVKESERCNNREEMVNGGERREECHIGKLKGARTRKRNAADASDEISNMRQLHPKL